MPQNYEKPKKYVPGPGDPELPPQLTEFQNKNTDEVIEELNRMPFFMTKLDDTDGDGGNNLELEALKALAYEGEPHEIAENFKNQGNDLYKAKRYKEAREMYNKGLEIKCDVAKINEALYSNRAACELELKNYRRCINDCKHALQHGPKNIKCYFRMGKAFFALSKLDDAEEAVNFGLKFDSSNASLKSLLAQIVKTKEDLLAQEAKRLAELKEKEKKQALLDAALILRNYTLVSTSSPPEFLEQTKLYLENDEDIESQLIFPSVIVYPTIDEIDFVASVGELSTPGDLVDIVLQRPQEWFEQENHRSFTPKNLICYMETESGGLTKVGKKVSFHDVLKLEKPNVPLFDKALRVYMVPKSESTQWLEKWDKNEALERRLKN
ncbi:LAFE_0G13212g1_1 [Lachancea fermentati]|uniref:LAFE_0G13212g1_1 n=1 Tax=Lachancea fermentati TaxID=4955 RepID=A0A1G4MII5_LACFM|nr:LAFE_0G13212g1_1 [Lachancea fermentati]